MVQPWRFIPFLSSIWMVLSSPQAQGPTRRTLFSEPFREVPGPEKDWTGFRAGTVSERTVYYHGQTVAVVELGPMRELMNCELLEVKTARDRTVALDALAAIKKKTRISFKNMMDLMLQCEKLPTPQNYMSNAVVTEPTNMPYYTTLFQGIFPGTKWCGTGDLAETYYDLGQEQFVDKCCRTHDLCPIKVSGMTTQYNLTNYSMVTRSHCACDKAFHDCLKNAKSHLSDLIGSLYFNLGNLKCVDDVTRARSGLRNLETRNNSIRYQRI